MPDEPQSLLRRYRVAIISIVVVFGALIGFRAFLNYRADLPIVDPYLAALNEVASQSPRVRQRLEEYYAKHQRRTVASKHYAWLCTEIQELAGKDGVGKDLVCPIVLDTYEKP
jgi:hypothetical protein